MVTFSRGFPDRIEVEGVDNLLASEALLSPRNAITHVHAVNVLDDQLPSLVSQLAQTPASGLDLWSSDHDAMLSNHAIGSLATLNKLRRLSLRNQSQLTDVAAEHLAKMSNLVSLSLSGVSFTDAGLSSLASMTHLTHLTANTTLATREGAELIARSGLSESAKKSCLKSMGYEWLAGAVKRKTITPPGPG
jgi:hypothetical protein